MTLDVLKQSHLKQQIIIWVTLVHTNNHRANYFKDKTFKRSSSTADLHKLKVKFEMLSSSLSDRYPQVGTLRH